MTEETRKKIVLVRLAIGTIRHADAEVGRLMHDGSSHSDDRIAAVSRLANRKNEFGWQWQNVEEILNELAPEQRQ